MDITNFMTWFINEVAKIFTNGFSILQNIQFMGTNLLQVIITILILTTLIPIIFTIAPNGSLQTGYRYGREQKIKQKIRERENK